MSTPPPPSLPTALERIVNKYQCQLALHKYSARGIVADYQMVLPAPNPSIESVIEQTEDLFNRVCSLYTSDYRYKVRLVGLAEYERLNSDGRVIGRETYHHASYQSEWCSSRYSGEFYRRHLLKIANRVDTFLRNGSSLRFIGYKHIHIALSVVSGGMHPSPLAATSSAEE